MRIYRIFLENFDGIYDTIIAFGVKRILFLANPTWSIYF